MVPNTLHPDGHLDFSRKIHELMGQTEKYAALCDSPRRVEFKYCALFAAWESTACHDSKASHWIDVWQRHCRKRHHGKTARTLADPEKASPLSHGPQEEAKAYTSVRHGLRQVFRATLNHYYPKDGTDP